MKDKIKTQEALTGIVRKLKDEGKTVGFTNGCFDILHLGHVEYMQEAKDKCDILIVGLNSDSSVRMLKGDERPLNPQDARATVLAALCAVDYITIFNEETPLELIKKLTPNILFKGGDWKEDDIAGADHVKGAGGNVCVIPYVEGYSTTGMINKMKG